MKLVAWVLDPMILEELFKRGHGIGTGAEMLEAKMDDTTGVITCVFGVSDDVYSTLVMNDDSQSFSVAEGLN